MYTNSLAETVRLLQLDESMLMIHRCQYELESSQLVGFYMLNVRSTIRHERILDAPTILSTRGRKNRGGTK